MLRGLGYRSRLKAVVSQAARSPLLPPQPQQQPFRRDRMSSVVAAAAATSPPPPPPVSQTHAGAKRSWQGDGKFASNKHKKQKKPRPAQQRSEGTHDEVLSAELQLLSLQRPDASTESYTLPEPFTEIELEIRKLSSTGDGIGYSSTTADHPYIVPFTLPGDVVRAKVIRHSRDVALPRHTTTDFVSVVSASPDRDDSLIGCRYFATCSGCQLQMAPYEYQLRHKRNIVVDAYRHFSDLPASLLPEVEETLPSPLRYGYRTKLTPHFDGPLGGRRKNRHGEPPRFESVPPIGFMKKGTRRTLDIEECPIATETVQKGLKRERAKVVAQLDTYRKGATILLRESSRKISHPSSEEEGNTAAEALQDESRTVTVGKDSDYALEKTCISDNRAESTEYVRDWQFLNPANAFFQNNNSILPSFTDYIREQLERYNAQVDATGRGKRLATLIDAYSGSGLFTIALSPLFEASIGIDISSESIEYARKNAVLNGVASEGSSQSGEGGAGVQFLASTAADIFAAVPAAFDARATAVVIDPPRKGADEGFLRQLAAFGPAVVVYVSCNVHTQARDVGWLLRHAENRGGGGDGGGDEGEKKEEEEEGDKQTQGQSDGYDLVSLRGCDFFPQTGHVEGVAVLHRRRRRRRRRRDA